MRSKSELLNPEKSRALSKASSELTPKKLALLGMQDFKKHQAILNQQTSLHEEKRIALHNIHALALSLGLDQLADASKYMEEALINNDELSVDAIGQLENVAQKSFVELGQLVI